nr:thiol-activated cytolysin family protein [uncultured Porphyromonas sp.]
MKKTAFAFALVAGLCFASCGESSNGGGAPTPTPDNKDPKNIQEVEQLLRSAGHVSEPAEDKLTAKAIGASTSEPALGHIMESTGDRADCDKVIQPMQCGRSSSAGDFAVLDPLPSILWPGSFIQGKSIRGKGGFTVIPYIAKRQPGRISLQTASGAESVGSGGEGLWYEEIQEMRESEVNQAQTKLIRHWQESGAPASTSYTMQIIHSPEEAMIASGIDLDKSGGKLKTFLSTGFDKKKSHVLVKLYQRFYTFGYEDPEGGGKGAFKSTIEQSDLAPYTGAGNPICYVSSVSYGRAYYFLYESSESSYDLLDALSASFKSFLDERRVESYVIKGVRVRMLEQGSSTNAGQGTEISPEKVFKLLEEGAQPSSKDVGVPISFTLKHLYDGQPVRMSNSLNYSYDKVSYIPRRKSNSVAIFLKEIVVENNTRGSWASSNKGYVKLLDAEVAYTHTGNSNRRVRKPIYREQVKMPQAGLRSTAYLATYKGRSLDCDFNGENLYNTVTFTVDLEIRPEAYNRNGGRVGQSPQRVTLKRTFRYDEVNRQWKPLGDGANMGGDAFHTLTTTRTFEGLTFNIRANFSFFVDNTLIE